MRPRIGVTTNGGIVIGQESVGGSVINVPIERLTISHDYFEVLQQHQADVLLLPPLSSPEILDGLDGLLLSGGRDIDSSLYGQQPHPRVGETYPDVDRAEAALITEALARQLPLLAICRGHQLLNIALGGSLHQHLPDLASSVNHRPRDYERVLSHRVHLDGQGLLGDILAVDRIEVNSSHHQGLDRLGKALRPVAWSDDDLVEAVVGPGPFCLGVQWHPEAIPNQDSSQQIFESFVLAAGLGGH